MGKKDVKGWLNCCGTEYVIAKFMNLIFNEPTIHSISINKNDAGNVENIKVYATVWDYSDFDANSTTFEFEEVMVPKSSDKDQFNFYLAWYKFVNMLNGERKIDGKTYYEFVKEKCKEMIKSTNSEEKKEIIKEFVKNSKYLRNFSIAYVEDANKKID